MDFAGCWDGHLSLMQVAYSNSYQAKIHMAPMRFYMGRGVGHQYFGKRMEPNNLWDRN